jgi:SAM-dependent methyltransferase
LSGHGLDAQNRVAYGLDIDRQYLSLASQNASRARLVQGDAHCPPYASGSFDLLICHFLLLWVADPQGVVNEVARLVRPGGSVLALAEPDYGGRVDHPEELADLGRLQENALRRQGAETRLGRRLGSLLRRAGLVDVECGVLGGQWRGAPSQEDWESEWAMMEADLADMLSVDELARLRQLDAQAWEKGERTLFVPTFYAWGVKGG